MKMDDQFKLQMPGETPASIEHEPTELIGRKVALAAQRSALRKNAETRSILRGVEEIEPCSDNRTYGALEEEDRTL